MQKFTAFCLALVAGALSLLPIAARAELPGPQLVAVGKKLGGATEQTAAIDSVIGTYSSALDGSLYKQADAAGAKAARTAGRRCQGASGLPGRRREGARRRRVQGLPRRGATGSDLHALESRRQDTGRTARAAQADARPDQGYHAESGQGPLSRLGPLCSRKPDNPTISAHGMAAMANLIDRIQYGSDQAVSKDAGQVAVGRISRRSATRAEEMAAILRGKRNEGYHGRPGRHHQHVQRRAGRLAAGRKA